MQRLPAVASGFPRLTPLFQEGLYFGGIMVITLFQLARVLGGQLGSIAIEHDQHWQSKARRRAIAFDNALIMSLVHIDQNNDIVLLHDAGEFSIGFEQTAQFMAPASPVGAEL